MCVSLVSVGHLVAQMQGLPIGGLMSKVATSAVLATEEEDWLKNQARSLLRMVSLFQIAPGPPAACICGMVMMSFLPHDSCVATVCANFCLLFTA